MDPILNGWNEVDYLLYLIIPNQNQFIMPTIIEFKNHLIAKGPKLQFVLETFFEDMQPDYEGTQCERDYMVEREKNTDLEWAGDLEEFMAMSDAELIAWCQLMHTMNFLFFASDRIKDGTDFLGDPEDWKKVNFYWVDKYPIAYHSLETWVWG